MTRRGFLKTLISAAGAVAAAPYVPSIIREPVQAWYDHRSQELAIALANSMKETKAVITFNVMSRAFGDPNAKDV